jgi:hypothetical protein
MTNQASLDAAVMAVYRRDPENVLRFGYWLGQGVTEFYGKGLEIIEQIRAEYRNFLSMYH